MSIRGIGRVAGQAAGAWRIALLGMIAGLVASMAVGATSTLAVTTTVQVGQQNGGAVAANQFNAASITIAPGDTVNWTWFSNTFGHTVTSYDETGSVPDWQSPILNGSGQSFDHTFPSAGLFTYYCSIHATRADADPANIDKSIAAGKMVGKVLVLAPSVGGVASLPDTAALASASPRGGGGGRFVWVVSLVAAATSVTALYFAIRRARRARAGAPVEGHD